MLWRSCKSIILDIVVGKPTLAVLQITYDMVAANNFVWLSLYICSQVCRCLNCRGGDSTFKNKVSPQIFKFRVIVSFRGSQFETFWQSGLLQSL